MLAVVSDGCYYLIIDKFHSLFVAFYHGLYSKRVCVCVCVCEYILQWVLIALRQKCEVNSFPIGSMVCTGIVLLDDKAVLLNTTEKK